MVLQPVDDSHVWRLSTNRKYSAKSAYEGMFLGAIPFRPWEMIWKSWAPGKCRFFMWLVAHKRCWTVDRLARRGLPTRICCPLCDQHEELINHLLCACPFSREFWFLLLQKLSLQALTPQIDDVYFDDWWESAESLIDNQTRKGLNSI